MRYTAGMNEPPAGNNLIVPLTNYAGGLNEIFPRDSKKRLVETHTE